MTQTNGTATLIDALRKAWSQEQRSVQLFGLSFVEKDIRFTGDGYSVPVASGVQTGSAVDLARTLTHLQELTEQRSGISVTPGGKIADAWKRMRNAPALGAPVSAMPLPTLNRPETHGPS